MVVFLLILVFANCHFVPKLTFSLVNITFRGKENEPFYFENASNLTHEFFIKNFVVKFVILKLMCQI